VFLGLVAAVWAVFLWIGGWFLAEWAPSERGRDPLGWWVLAFALSPPVALLTLNALPALDLAFDAVEEPDEAERGRAQVVRDPVGRLA
jgi:hypothetical protein